MCRAAILIDGGYLDKILKIDLERPRIDYSLLSKRMSSGINIQNTFYYGCFPYRSCPPTQDEESRYRRACSFYNYLKSLRGFIVRLGRLERRRIDGAGSDQFVQKQVDGRLVADLVFLACKHAVTHVAILAGDSDFVPGIETAKSEGVKVHLFSGSSPHHELVQVCDEHTRITEDFIR